MEVVLIKHISRYDDLEDVVDIALSMDIAKAYVEDLKEKYPYAYGDDYGEFVFEEYKVIDE